MANFTESQVLTLTLIATSNIVLIVVALILLFSGKKSDKNAPKETPTKVVKLEDIKPKVKEVVEEIKEEPETNAKRGRKKQEQPVEEEPEIDYNDYKIDQYSDEEYKYSSIEEFENQQEENAIISYNELMKLKDNYEEPIEEKTRRRKVEEIEDFVPKKKNAEPTIEEPKPKPKYNSQEFISPVFGRMTEDNEYIRPKRVERQTEKRYNTPQENEVAKRFDSNTEFLRALKEFRNNL